MSGIYRGYDQPGLDAQYNCRAAVPDHERYFERYAELSRGTRARRESRLDESYGSHLMEALDIFPVRGMAMPTWIFFHGGWWRSLDKSDFSYVADGFHEAGVSVVVPNYQLAPGATIAEIVREAREATRWVIEHAPEWNGDARRVFVGGHSAGGHMAALAAVTEPVAGVVSISGVHDVEPVSLSYVNEWARLRPDETATLSPLHQLPHRALPLVAAVGADETDEFRRQNALLAEAWRGRGYPVTELSLAGHHHFSIVLDLAEPKSTLTLAILDQILGRVTA